MKKNIVNFFSLIIAFVLLFTIAACDSQTSNNSNNNNNSTSQTDNGNGDNNTSDPNGSNSNNNSPSQTGTNTDNSSENEFVIYTDSAPIENDKIKIEPQTPSCYGTDNYSLSLRFKITNKEYKKNEYTFKNTKLVKESTGAEYTVGGFYTNKLTIEAELNQSFSLSATIPSSITNDNYKLSLEINDYKIIYYFYETPDSLRADRTINYYVLNKIVKTVTVKDKRKLESLFVYETTDNLSYCDTWYTDSTLRTKFSINNPISSDINLYGFTSSNIKWMTLSSDVYSFVNGINHVPSSGILVLPEKNQNKELCIGNYAIRNISVSKIYIPKTVHTIYGGNFTGIGNATIYYAGTESEWKALFYNPKEAPTSNVVFNTTYNG